MRKLILAACVAFLFACEDELPTFENTPPSPFLVTVESATTNAAFITWTESVDAEMDSVYYDLFLNGARVSGGSNLRVKEFSFSNLEPGTNYTGIVSARDVYFDKTEMQFAFNTLAQDTI